MTTAPRTSRTIVASTVIALVALGAGLAIGHHRGAAPGTIAVTGTASATGTPDTVAFSIGVSTSGASTASALAANNARTRAVETALLAAGARKSGLATSGLNVSTTTDNQGRVTGYQVYDELTVTSHLVTRAGSLIAAALGAAGNTAQLSGITYSITDQSAVLARARAHAVANAERAASQLAHAAHRSLGAVTSVVDLENNQPVIYPVPYAFGAVKAASSVPVEAGTQSVSVTVKVSYALA